MDDLVKLKARLSELLVAKSVCHGEFTLVSGAKSDFYVDSKLTTLDPEGSWLLGKLGWDLIKRVRQAKGINLAAIGGLTMGADPIAHAISMVSWLDEPGQALQTFSVRKSPKAHGRNKLIEGSFQEGQTVVVVDDVITTGGSTLAAIDAVVGAGGQVAFVVVLVDRQEGGRANIEKRGCEVHPLFTRQDLS